MKTPTDDKEKDMNELKKEVFYRLLSIAGRVFIFVGYSEDVSIGRRGFLPEEKERGLVLVFNERMNFNWLEDSISAKLVFGTMAESCHIPLKNIISIYSPEIGAQLIVNPEAFAALKNPLKNQTEKTVRPIAPPEPERPLAKDDELPSKIIQVDFTKDKKR